MATYKVPQNVEADDKLIGPFSFRQFIYLIAVAMAGGIAWGLAQIFIGLAIIPLPIIIFFGALALPLRKDQPMEIYMAAMVSYYLKPRKRLWDPEGIETLIEITAPKTYEDSRSNNLSQNEAQQRLGYLANLVDSGGWAIRGASGAPNTTVNNDVFLEAQSAPDVLDANNSVGQAFNQMMAEGSVRAKEEAVERMKATIFAPTPAPISLPPAPSYDFNAAAAPAFDPYPTDIQQTVIQPLNDPSHNAQQHIAPQPVYTAPVTPTPVQAPQPVAYTATQPQQSSVTTSSTPVSADIIKLVDNAEGLSVETLAHEAHRIHKKIDEESDEVVISLR